MGPGGLAPFAGATVVMQRLDRVEAGRAPGRVKAAYCPQHQRYRHALDQERRAHHARRKTGHGRRVIDQPYQAQAYAHTQQSTQGAQHQRLAQNQAQHTTPPPADGSQHANFPRLLKDGHHHSIHHA